MVTHLGHCVSVELQTLVRVPSQKMLCRKLCHSLVSTHLHPCCHMVNYPLHLVPKLCKYYTSNSPYRIQCNSSSNRSPYRIQCNSSSNRSPYRIQCNSSSNRSPYRIQCNSSSNRSPYRIQCNSSSNRSPYRIQCNSSSNRSPYKSNNRSLSTHIDSRFTFWCSRGKDAFSFMSI